MTQPVQEPSDPRSVSGLDYRIKQLARRPPPFAQSSFALDFAQIGMSLQQLITQSTAWSGVGFTPVGIDMDNYLVAPGGADTEHSPTGAFVIDTVNKRLELRRSGIYFLMVQLSETGEWLGLTDYYWWNLLTSGAGFIWNSDPTYQLNMFGANAPYAEWYKTHGPLLVMADDTHPVKTDFQVAQQKFSPAVLNAFLTTWCFMGAQGITDYDENLLANQGQYFGT